MNNLEFVLFAFQTQPTLSPFFSCLFIYLFKSTRLKTYFHNTEGLFLRPYLFLVLQLVVKLINTIRIVGILWSVISRLIGIHSFHKKKTFRSSGNYQIDRIDGETDSWANWHFMSTLQSCRQGRNILFMISLGPVTFMLKAALINYRITMMTQLFETAPGSFRKKI